MEPNMSENITVTRQSLKALLCDEWVASDKANQLNEKLANTRAKLEDAWQEASDAKNATKEADADTAKAVDAIRALLRAIRDEHPNWKHAAVSAAADYLDARIHDARVDGARP